MTESLLDPAADWHVPPGVCMAVREGDALHTVIEGMARLDPAEPMTAAHRHDLASVSKLVTVLTLDALVLQGRLSWETTLAEVLGERAGQFSSATLNEVVRHRAGFRPWEPMYLRPEALRDPVGCILQGERGPSRTVYSDLGMQVAAEVIATVVGLPYADAVGTVLGEAFVAQLAHERGGVPTPVAASSVGDAIEQHMVATGEPYPVAVTDDGFDWRTNVLQGETSDCNAHYVYGGAAGHAGWFTNLNGALALGDLLLERGSALASDPVDGIAQGVRVYEIERNGRSRTLIGHPGFTGTFVGASAGFDDEPPLVVVWLSNRLHGLEPVPASRLAPVDQLWRRGLAEMHRRFGGIE